MAENRTSRTVGPDHDEPVSAFAEALFAHLPRADQRRWAQIYLQGLLSTPGRKSIRRLAEAVSTSPTASQSLQQFINSSPWDWVPARRELIRLAEAHTTTRALTIGTAVLPKRGEYTCGVHRRFVPALGRTISCQAGLGIFLSTGEHDVPIEWRLLLPEPWNTDTERRERARIPDSVGYRPVWAQTLDLVDAATETLVSPARLPVVADMSEHPDVGRLLSGLGKRGHDFVVAVPAGMQVLPGDPRLSTENRSGSELRHNPLGALAFLLRRSTPAQTAGPFAPERRVRRIGVRSGLVRLPGSTRTHRLFTEGRPEGSRPARVWITNMVGRHVEEVAALAQLQSGAPLAVDSLERDYGLLDFEGRSFPGWHHHMTLVSAAYTYDRVVRPAEESREALLLSA
ncbi:IS701 family transposase [Streptomyces sp. NPDC059533]|uniref:IS701 family transposase n=1 Tax=unclassified Streptomyces TaxID=2593676 RepID=UPI0036824941